jgi:hypothetical protein
MLKLTRAMTMIGFVCMILAALAGLLMILGGNDSEKSQGLVLLLAAVPGTGLLGVAWLVAGVAGQLSEWLEMQSLKNRAV